MPSETAHSHTQLLLNDFLTLSVMAIIYEWIEEKASKNVRDLNSFAKNHVLRLPGLLGISLPQP
jgi:hypothetical protein